MFQIIKSKYQIHFLISYLDLSFDKGSNVILILEDGEGLQQVMFQPLPVLCDLLTGGSWRGVMSKCQQSATVLTDGAQQRNVSDTTGIIDMI